MGLGCCVHKIHDSMEFKFDENTESSPSKRLKLTVRSGSVSINPDGSIKSTEVAKSPFAGANAVFYPMYLVREYKGDVLESLYEPMEVIGEGSYGEVRKVTCKRTGCTRVMKTILKKKGSPDDKILDEIQILRKLVSYKFSFVGSSKHCEAF